MSEPAVALDFGSPPLLAALDSYVKRGAVLGIAVSGGADSAMLLVHAAQIARRRSARLHVLHVHHGLQRVADGWRDHVHDLSQMLAVPCHSLRISVDVSRKDGVESAAREARYHALSTLAGQFAITQVLLAHHRDDQAETVLLRLLRGAGPAGMGAMAPRSHRDGIDYLRPWLDISRAQIIEAAHAFHAATGWRPVVDPTNAEDRYTRSAVRERLTPQLDVRWPGWQAALARHARQSREAREILAEVAAQDFSSLEPSSDGSSFSLAMWRLLSEERQALVLRYWLASQGLRMPSEARLNDLMRQMRQLHALGHDREMKVKHGEAEIRCTRGRVLLK